MSLPASATPTASPAALAAAPSPDHILQIGFGFWASKTLLSAVEMEVFTELAKHPEDLEELTGRLGLHPRSARDFLDALVALGFLQRHERVYSNTPAADLYLDKKKPSYIGGILEMCNHRSYGHWDNLTEGLRTGLPQSELKGRGAPVFETIYADPARLKVPEGDDRSQPRRQPGDCGEIPLGELQVGSRRRVGAGRSAGPGGSQEPAPARHRIRSAGSRPDFRRVR